MNSKTKNQKNSVIRVFFILIILLLIITPTRFSATKLKTINYDVTLHDDGSATIKEERKIHPTEGTEQYISFTNMGDMEMKDISISDSSGLNYEFKDNWNVNSSREEKLGKFGTVNVSGGFELCFGINGYEEKTYFLEYTLTNFVKAYSDYDGFNYQFFESGNLTPDDIKVLIKKENQELVAVDENSENGNTAIWAFGYEGYIRVKNNEIIAQTDGRINYFTILSRFDKGIFNPTSTGKGSFIDLKDKALQDSEYEKENELQSKTSLKFLIFVFSGAIMIVVGLFWLFLNVMVPKYIDEFGKKRKIKIKKDDINYSREIPFKGNIPPTKLVVDTFYKSLGIKNSQNVSGSWFSAYLLRLLEKKIISIYGESEKKSVIIINDYKSSNLDYFEKYVLSILISATTGENGLTQKDLKKWSYANYEGINGLNKKIIIDAQQYLIKNGLLKEKEKAYTLLGVDEIKKVHGFKKFLDDFTIINERKPIEVALWGDYLVFATLFGMSSELAEIYNNINPEYFNSNYGYNYNTFIYLSAFSRSYDRGYVNAASVASSGGGGSSSFSGGGGGSSGGGSSGVR